MMSFITFLTKKWTVKKIRLLYFVVQRVGSLFILSGGMFSGWRGFIEKWVILGILLKTRLAPLHFWGAVLITKLSNMVSYIFLTWQKIAPVFLLLITTPKYIIYSIMIINVLVGSRCGIGSKNILVLLFFSGLNHIRWLIAAPVNRALFYFTLYTIISFPIFFQPTAHNLPILILNLAGLPPMTGFFIKLLVLEQLSVGVGCVMVILTAPLLFAYIRAFLISSRHPGSLRPLTVCVSCIGFIF